MLPERAPHLTAEDPDAVNENRKGEDIKRPRSGDHQLSLSSIVWADMSSPGVMTIIPMAIVIFELICQSRSFS